MFFTKLQDKFSLNTNHQPHRDICLRFKFTCLNAKKTTEFICLNFTKMATMVSDNDNRLVEEIRRELEENGPAAAAERIQEHLERQNNIPLNIAVTGESGSGKSTFVNAFRGIDNRDPRAAPTDCIETTTEVTPYPHPDHPNVTLWDLPGIGTISFPPEEYLNIVGFERFDFFIIISADRFRKNDVMLAQAIQRMKKKFYFVRTKMDHTMRDEEDSQRDFDPERTLTRVRANCIQGLRKQGVESQQVFLISSRKLHLYDFHRLQETLEKELPAHKRDVLLLSMPSISLEIINKKKDAFGYKIKYYAGLSALRPAAQSAGLPFTADVIMLRTVREYQIGFGLDVASLQRLARGSGVSMDDLKAVVTSPLAATEISIGLINSILLENESTLIAAEEWSKYIPAFGIPVAMTCAFASTYRALNTFLNMLAEDAQRAFQRALGLNTSV